MHLFIIYFDTCISFALFYTLHLYYTNNTYISFIEFIFATLQSFHYLLKKGIVVTHDLQSHYYFLLSGSQVWRKTYLTSTHDACEPL